MRGLLQLFAAYGGFLTFLVLEIVSLVLIVQFNHRQNEIFNNTWGLYLTAGEQQLDNLTDYIGLKEEVIKLQAKNIKLMQQQDNALYAGTAYRDSAYTDSLKQLYTFIGANVISNSIISTNNFLRLDRGEEQGVQPHTAVISDDGIVGIVQEVTDHYCRVMSILNSQARIKAAIRSNGYFGTLTWNGKDPQRMQLEAIPKHAEVVEGDVVVTSGYSYLFPEGIVIGTVESKKTEPGENFHTIVVKLHNDLSKVQYVYIVNNLMREEHKELDASENE